MCIRDRYRGRRWSNYMQAYIVVLPVWDKYYATGVTKMGWINLHFFCDIYRLHVLILNSYLIEFNTGAAVGSIYIQCHVKIVFQWLWLYLPTGWVIDIQWTGSLSDIHVMFINIVNDTVYIGLTFCTHNTRCEESMLKLKNLGIIEEPYLSPRLCGQLSIVSCQLSPEHTELR